MTPTRINLQSADGHRFDAWRADPTGPSQGGAVVLHAIYGLTAHIGDVCQRWADAGYIAIAPALYDRHAKNLVHGYDSEGAAAGRSNYRSLSAHDILTDVSACADALDTAGRRIISGFCSGGTWAWVASAQLGFDAQVNFYGSHVAQKLDITPRCPTVMHYGDNDHIVPVADIEKIKAAHPNVVMHLYPGAGHAFFNPDQRSYSEAATEEAWRNTLGFLAGPPADMR